MSAADRKLLEEHEGFVRAFERELADAGRQPNVAAPTLEPGVKDTNDNIPKLSRMQIDLLVHRFMIDAARVCTFEYTNSVG